MKLYINIILKSFYFCNHSCDIHIFGVLYRLYKCSSMHVKTFRFPAYSNFRHCRRYRSSYMKARRGGWVRRHICFHCPSPYWISATTPLGYICVQPVTFWWSVRCSNHWATWTKVVFTWRRTSSLARVRPLCRDPASHLNSLSKFTSVYMRGGPGHLGGILLLTTRDLA